MDLVHQIINVYLLKIINPVTDNMSDMLLLSLCSNQLVIRIP